MLSRRGARRVLPVVDVRSSFEASERHTESSLVADLTHTGLNARAARGAHSRRPARARLHRPGTACGAHSRRPARARLHRSGTATPGTPPTAMTTRPTTGARQPTPPHRGRGRPRPLRPPHADPRLRRCGWLWPCAERCGAVPTFADASCACEPCDTGAPANSWMRPVLAPGRTRRPSAGRFPTSARRAGWRGPSGTRRTLRKRRWPCAR